MVGCHMLYGPASAREARAGLALRGREAAEKHGANGGSVACHEGMEGVVPPFRDVGGPRQEHESGIVLVPHVVAEDRRGGRSAIQVLSK